MRVLNLLCLLSLVCCHATCCRRLAEFLAYCLSYCFFTRRAATAMLPLSWPPLLLAALPLPCRCPCRHRRCCCTALGCNRAPAYRQQLAVWAQSSTC